MSENKTGKTLRIIGIVIIVLGIIGSFILSVNIDDDFPITLLVGALVSFMSGMCFIGFSEIIMLLQKSVDQQQMIIKKMQISSYEGTTPKATPKTMIQDIESNLPQI